MKKTFYSIILSIGLASCGSDSQAPAPAAPESGPPSAASTRLPALPSEDSVRPAPDTLPPAVDSAATVARPAQPKGNAGKGTGTSANEEIAENVKAAEPSKALPPSGRGPSNSFSDIQTLEPSIRLDIRYATSNNFTSAKIYDCPRCLLRPEAAKALLKAHRALQRQGLGLKMFDCYRPRPYQQRLWDKVPNPDYVTPPAKGSMHSRGAAVDLTIVDANGNELDMGTPYDYFGREAHYDYTGLPGKVLANRRLLRRTMEAAGFRGIRTEWWHFSFKGKNYPLSDYVWDCE